MRRAFTLIELLVVVSIISLLIAILLPALSASRRTAQDIQCMSNMRSLVAGELAYAVDNDQVLPEPDEWIWNKDRLGEQATGTLPPGVTATSGFRRYTADYTTTEAAKFGTLNPYISDFNAHLCPVASEQPINGLKWGYAPLGNKVLRSYVQNQYVSADPNNRYSYTLDTTRVPGEMLVISEENTFIMNSRQFEHRHFGDHPMNDGRLDLTWDHVGSLHRRIQGDNLRSGYASAAFMDGHVDWVFSQSKIINPKDGRRYWSTESFGYEFVQNHEEMNRAFIDQSRDYDFSY